MGKQKAKVFVKVLLAGTVLCALLSGCGGSNRSAGGGPTVIRIAHNWPREMDTTFRDPITGEPALGQQELNARIYAEQQVLEKLNVKFSWIPYPGALEEDILRSVLANDPLAELVRVVGGHHGTLLGQNVLQDLDDYESLFADEDSNWMYWGRVYGHHYFLNNVMRYGNDAPLAYNIGMLEKVPALRENGKTVLPVDLWLEGRWTWNVFEDYLQKVHDYWIQDWDGRMAYGAHHIVAAQMAMHANGTSVYGEDGLEIDSARAKEAVAYIERLMSKELIRSVDIIAGTSNINGLMDVWRFQWGHSVFCNLQQWLAGDMVNQFNGRNETMGIVPFPRPDGMAPNDPNYRQLNDAKDAYAVPRGVSKETAELAVKAFREYTVSYYKRMANSDRALDYLQSDGAARTSAISMFLDITNEDYGEKLLAAWKFLGSNENIHTNEFARIVGIQDLWGEEILGDSLYRIRGASQYAVQVEARMGIINERMNTIQRALSGNEVRDNIPPRFSDTGGQMLFPAGMNPADIDWSAYLSINDNVDGPIPFSNARADVSGVNFGRPGRYDEGASFSVNDRAGNTGTAKRTVTVFDASNTAPPSLAIRGDYRNIRLDENTADIRWKDDFVESARDRDGLDVSDNIFADLSELDTSRAGSYSVALTVTDHAGNTASSVITITVDIE